MKTLHITFTFPPDAPGGTEVYVEGLCRELQHIGIETVVVAPGSRDETYERNGLRVRRFATAAGPPRLEVLYGAGDSRAALGFASILAEEAPDLVHQHALTPACSIELVRQAKQRGLPVVFTYHTATTTCQRGTLLEWGRVPCDGRLDVARCTACTLHGLGVARTVSRLVARMPLVAGDLLGRIGFRGRALTALRMSSLTDRRHGSVTDLFKLVDKVVVLTPWVEDLLRLNGMLPERLAISRHGVSAALPLPSSAPAVPKDCLRLVHLGRVNPAKGTGLLIKAVRSIPEAAIELDVFGVVQDHGSADVLNGLYMLAQGDPRIRFLPPLDHADVIGRLTRYDMVVVPSQWMETGPLVVLEAFVAGVPVLGADLGGIADKVTDDVDGLLVRPYDSVEAWSATLLRLVQDRSLLKRLASGVRPPRSMMEVAREMQALYESLAVSRIQPARGQAVRRPDPLAIPLA